MTPIQLELFEQYGDAVAHRAAASVVRRYPAATSCIEDITQEGRLAVLRAVEKHDPRRGEFEPYAYRAAFNAASTHARALIRSASGYGKNNYRHFEPRVDADSPEVRQLPSGLDVERAIAARQVSALVATRLARGVRAPKVGTVDEDVSAFVAWRVDDGSIWDLAKDRGVSRQALQQRFARADFYAKFDRITAELRAEAA